MRLLALLALTPALACGVIVEGDFQGVPFTPDAVSMAVADQHELLVRNGAIIPITKPLGQQTLSVLLTAARLDAYDDWRRYPTDTLLEIKRELATADTVFLKNIPLRTFDEGTSLEALQEEGRQTGDFTFFVGAALPEQNALGDNGLGSKVRVRVEPKELAVNPRGGFASMRVSIQREREAGQAGDVATGEVTLDFGATLLPERLTESNFTVAEPVVACVHDRGPAAAGACRDVDALPYVDETGLVD